MRQLILNSIQTPDGTILTSYHRHDYKTYTDKNGEEYMVDGGIDYLRRNTNKEPYKDLSLYLDSPFEDIRANITWGVNMDKDKNILPETKWTPICDLKTDHIQAILDGGYGNEWIREFFKQELEYRNK